MPPNPSQRADGLRSDDPGSGYGGTIGRTLRESTPWWPPRTQARAGSPNVIIVLLDDLGFADLGCYGAGYDTPHIDALAANGLRLANYTTVPMCTPARAALLTGKNPHAVGCGWLTFNAPGYPGYRAGEMTRDAPTIAELLREHGYSTYAAGKWHNTAEYNVTPAGERASWPLQRGFDRFYGFVGGETHYFAPAQLFEDNAIVDRDTYAPDYYCTDDWTDRAISWLKAHCSSAPDKPFFLYLPYNAPHAPLHAKPVDLARHAGRYDAGWDALRAACLARQKAAGLVTADTRLPARSAGVPAWDSLPAERRRVLARYMELYAAIVDNIDQNIGRVTAFLREAGILDNTLVIITSDNGANGIGGPEGAVNNLAKRLAGSEDPAMVARVVASGGLGGHATWPTYPLGWTDVSSTPFRLYKTTTMNGGIRVPMVVHWPAGIADAGAVRKQWVHVTDILPTVLDLLQLSYPDAWAGYRTRGMDGVSFRSVLSDADAPSARSRQHYELAGNRGYILGKWKIVSLQPPGRPIDLDRWMLFDLEADPTEIDDRAADLPEKLAELVAAFEADADANYVYPLDNRDIRRALAVPPFLEADLARQRTFYPDAPTVALAVVGPMVADRDFRLACRFSFSRGDSGVIFALGDPIAGMALFVRDDRLWFVFHGGSGLHVVRDDLPLTAGDNQFTLEHRALGERRGSGTISLNGASAGPPLDMSPTLVLGWVGEGLDVGVDRKQHVTAMYQAAGTFPFTGRVDHVRIEPGPHPADSYANRPERASQLS
ncbi:MAG: arylsulfatase [Burkholderiales bacterium]|nr:arylsulfatase [Burkholderiales bacterium]